MIDDIHSTSGEKLQTLCQEAIALVKSLPGPVRRLAVRTPDHAVEVEWPIGAAAPIPIACAELSTPVSRTLAATLDKTQTVDADAAAHVILSPLVGTFRRTPQPEADPFVSVSDIIEVGQTVAIVEAMKLVNHIAAEVAGRVVEICVGDGEPVEFEQPLMRILPVVNDKAA